MTAPSPRCLNRIMVYSATGWPDEEGDGGLLAARKGFHPRLGDLAVLLCGNATYSDSANYLIPHDEWNPALDRDRAGQPEHGGPTGRGKAVRR